MSAKAERPAQKALAKADGTSISPTGERHRLLRNAPGTYNECEGIFPDGKYTAVEGDRQVAELGGNHGMAQHRPLEASPRRHRQGLRPA